MNTVYSELVVRIRGELEDLQSVIQRAVKSWEKAQKISSEQDVYIDSVALNLHGFYSGIERLFELIARHVDCSIPNGSTWHRVLLHRMAEDLADVRPAVISHDSAQSLDEFRRFRHLVRNVYTMNLAPDKVASLMLVLPGLWEKVNDELLAFSDFMEQLAKA